MTGASVEVKGGDRLATTLHEAATKLADMPGTNRDVAEIVVRTARSLAPIRTGALAASIRPEGSASEARAIAGGPGMIYPAVMEWGSQVRGIVAQPFLRPAAEQTQQEWEGAYAKGVQTILDTTVRGA